MVCGALGACGPFARGHAMALKKLWDGHGNSKDQDTSEDVRKAAMNAITQMGAKTRASRNVLLTDPTIIAMSTPPQTQRDAETLVIMMKSALKRLTGLAATARPLPRISDGASVS